MYSATDEIDELKELFLSSFKDEKDIPKILFGTGVITRHLLQYAEEYNITAVASDNADDDTFCGFPILNPNQIPKDSVLIVVSRYINIKRIVARIRPSLPPECQLRTINNQNVETLEIFNDIMQFCDNDTERKLFNNALKVAESDDISASDFGYYFLGPLILSYVNWMRKTVLEHDLRQVLFLARDGYLLQKVWKKLMERYPIDCKDYYILASRNAYTAMSVYEESDIYRGLRNIGSEHNIRACIKRRLLFDIGLDDTDKTVEILIDEYKTAIIDAAACQRKCYLDYLNDQGVTSERAAVVDLVSSGTMGRLWGEITGRKDESLCLLASKIPEHSTYDEVSDFYAFMGEDVGYVRNLNIHRFVSQLEGVVTSSQGSFLGYDKNGQPLFGVLENPQKNFSVISEIQDGVVRFAEDEEIEACEKLSIKAVDSLWGFGIRKLFEKKSKILEYIGVEDTFGKLGS